MIGNQRPGKTTCAAFVYDCAESFQEIVATLVVAENIAFFDSFNFNEADSKMLRVAQKEIDGAGFAEAFDCISGKTYFLRINRPICEF